MKLRVVPLTFREANRLVSDLHRHHLPVVGHRFSIGLVDDGGVVRGCAIVGRPVARAVPVERTAEVTRVATDGTANACSMLLGAAARAAKAMGFDTIQTYTLEEESGSSLRAAGWKATAVTKGREWKHTAGSRRTDQPNGPKVRWECVLNEPAPERVEQ